MLETALRDGLLRQVPPLLRAWRGDALERDVDDRLALHLDRCHDRSFSRRFAEARPVEGCGPEDYLQRVLPDPDGPPLLAGIRFHGRLGLPFVDLVVSAAPLDDDERLAAALRRLRAAWLGFEPVCARLLRRTDRPPPARSVIDQVVVAGPIGGLADRPPVRHQERVRLEPTDDVDAAADEVQAAYRSLFEARPAASDYLQPATARDLARCAEEGVLAWVRVDDVRAGIIACRPTLGPLVRGPCVIEELLAAPFRGRGFGAAVQRRLVDHLARDDADGVLHGTIDRRNAASRAVARRVGRQEIAAWHWVPFPGEALPDALVDGPSSVPLSPAPRLASPKSDR